MSKIQKVGDTVNYLLFAGVYYESSGGHGDLIGGYERFDQASKAIGEWKYAEQWWQILDIQAMRVVWDQDGEVTEERYQNEYNY